jgi:hypothetical protein
MRGMDMDRYQKEKLMDIKAFFLKGLPPQGGTFLVASIADVLSEGLTVDEIIALASFLGSIGQLLGYIAAQKTINMGSKNVTLTVDDNTVTLRGV